MDGSGGIGKTFEYNTILGYLCGHGIKCMAMATKRFDACLLHKGQTTHSSLVILLQLRGKSTCCIIAQSLVVHNL